MSPANSHLTRVAVVQLAYHPAGDAYARWLEQAAPLLERKDDDDALESQVERIEQEQAVLLDAGALSGAKARGRRLRRLVDSRATGLCDAHGRWVEDKPFYDWLRRIADDELGER